MPDISMTEVIPLLRRLMELYKDRKKNVYIVFIDMEKAYARVLHVVLWECLGKKKGISGVYLSYQGHV